MKKYVLVAAAVAVVAGASALSLTHAPQARAADPAPVAKNDQCVDVTSLRTKMVVSKNQLVVEDDFHRAALLTLAPPCSQMVEVDHVGFVIDGDSRICQIHDMKILYSRTDERPVQCLIADKKMLSREELRAYTSPSSAKH